MISASFRPLTINRLSGSFPPFKPQVSVSGAAPDTPLHTWRFESYKVCVFQPPDRPCGRILCSPACARVCPVQKAASAMRPPSTLMLCFMVSVMVVMAACESQGELGHVCCSSSDGCDAQLPRPTYCMFRA